MPVQRASEDFGEYIEKTVIIEEPTIKQKRPLFIEANTTGASLKHLRNDCIISVFAKGSEATLSHVAFIEVVQDATNTFLNGEQIESPDVRVSYVIKSRIPKTIHKPASQLLESDKTIYYERCAFTIEVPTIYEIVHSNRLTLTTGGVKVYNHTNLYSKKGAERFKVFIGFICKVCTNLCVSTDDYLSCLEVTSTRDLYQAVLEIFHKHDAARYVHSMQSLDNTSMAEHQFYQLLGGMRLYQSLPQGYQEDIPRVLPTDTQVNNVVRAYINGENFGSLRNDLPMWELYNLLTGANKSSYVDSFLDRAYNTTKLTTGICSALHGGNKYQWFLSWWYLRIHRIVKYLISETMRSLFYLLVMIATFFVSALLYPVVMIGYTLLIGYCLTKRL